MIVLRELVPWLIFLLDDGWHENGYESDMEQTYVTDAKQ